MQKRPLFITFEGIDGAGKSTQINKLCAYLKKNKIEFVSTREPGGCEMSEKIREIILSEKSDLGASGELFLYFAARAEHIRQVIKPALDDEKWVICDRFADSTFAYQGAGRGLDIAKMKEINSFATQNINPNLTILLDISVKVSFERRKSRGISTDRLEKNDKFFFENVREYFLKLSQDEAKRFLVIDATLSEDEIHKKIIGKINL
ncbi:MAG: dTMP kinase [Chitinispirillales bacterium]|jgi:dTMP kinase|nr:dTMP kinase [Chitinispirillales bacterium]